MADFQGTTTVDAADDVLFAFLSDVHNLPKYFARMTSAEPGEGNEVHTTAALPDGSQVEGTAWFEVTDDSRHIAWGAEGESSTTATSTSGRSATTAARSRSTSTPSASRPATSPSRVASTRRSPRSSRSSSARTPSTSVPLPGVAALSRAEQDAAP